MGAGASGVGSGGATVALAGTLLGTVYSHPPPSDMLISLCVNVVLSVVGAAVVVRAVPALSSMFLSAGLSGRDLCKADQTRRVPESMGMVSGSVFLVVMFLFLGVPFGQHFMDSSKPFPHAAFSEHLTSLLSICCMLFLGFADDVLNLKWRYKLVLPTLASLPLLMVYYINLSSTTVVVPKPLRTWMGGTLDIGVLYYIYMSMLAVFCTNAINIYSGINGLESGQAVVMGVSVAVFNIVELGGYQARSHFFSLCVIIPFTATSLGLFYHNRYPARAFVGDTFTYFAGMTFAVVAIIGHFSKTVLLFFLPQVFNFLYSVPQLFHLLPCPRHRLPKYNKQLDRLEPSVAEFKSSGVRWEVMTALRVLNRLRLVRLREGLGEDGQLCEVNNLTLVNLLLVLIGPQHEATLTSLLLLLQVLGSGLAFFIRYPLADMFF